MSQSWRDHVLPCLSPDEQQEHQKLREDLQLPPIEIKKPSDADKKKFEKQKRSEAERDTFERERHKLAADREAIDTEKAAMLKKQDDVMKNVTEGSRESKEQDSGESGINNNENSDFDASQQFPTLPHPPIPSFLSIVTPKSPPPPPAREPSSSSSSSCHDLANAFGTKRPREDESNTNTTDGKLVGFLFQCVSLV